MEQNERNDNPALAKIPDDKIMFEPPYDSPEEREKWLARCSGFPEAYCRDKYRIVKDKDRERYYLMFFEDGEWRYYPRKVQEGHNFRYCTVDGCETFYADYHGPIRHILHVLVPNWEYEERAERERANEKNETVDEKSFPLLDALFEHH